MVYFDTFPHFQVKIKKKKIARGGTVALLQHDQKEIRNLFSLVRIV